MNVRKTSRYLAKLVLSRSFQSGSRSLIKLLAVAMRGCEIYKSVRLGEYRQLPSHHSKPDGTTDFARMEHDLGLLNVLVGDDLLYFGGFSLKMPEGMGFLGAHRGHRSSFRSVEQGLEERWFAKLSKGVRGAPAMWREGGDRIGPWVARENHQLELLPLVQALESVSDNRMVTGERVRFPEGR